MIKLKINKNVLNAPIGAFFVIYAIMNLCTILKTKFI